MASLDKATLDVMELPLKFHKLNSKTYPFNPAFLKSVESYAESFPEDGRGLKIVGPPSSSKTFLACHVLKYIAMKHRLVGTYFSMADLIETYFHGAYGEFKRRIKAPPILVIDNVNAPRHEGQKNALLRALRIRSDDGAPFILVTSLRDELFEDCYCIFHARAASDHSAAKSFRDDEVGLLCSKNLKRVSTHTD